MTELVVVLFIVSGASEIELASGEKMEAGFWAIELAMPYRELRKAGYEVHIATPGGKVPTPDPHTVKDKEMKRFLRSLDALQKPLVLEDLTEEQIDRYAAVVIPGGYSPMVDLAESKAVERILTRAMKNKAVVAAICHGPAAFLSAKDLFKGYNMAAFSNEEEDAWLKERKLKWRVEDALRDAGVKHTKTKKWGSHVVRDRNVITAQNAPSCSAFTKQILEALGK